MSESSKQMIMVVNFGVPEICRRLWRIPNTAISYLLIERAKEACANSGQQVANHFEDILEMITTGKTAQREVESVKLSRYACYLIVQNADPGKEVVALGQTYFAVQTRLQEIRQMEEYNRLSSEDEKRLFLRNELTKHNIQLAAAAKDAGVVEPIDYFYI